MKMYEKGTFSVSQPPGYGGNVYLTGRRGEICLSADIAVAMARAILSCLAPEGGEQDLPTELHGKAQKEGGAL